MTEYGYMLTASHTVQSYDRLVELAGLLDFEAPPPLSEWGTGRRVSDAWAVRVGLLHQGCRYERNGEHWAFQCRG